VQPETRFKIRVKADLAKLPCSWWVKTQQVTIRGTPDFLGCIGPYFVALELKKDCFEAPDPLQAYNLSKCSKSGSIAISVNPQNWDAVFTQLVDLAAVIKRYPGSVSTLKLQRMCWTALQGIR